MSSYFDFSTPILWRLLMLRSDWSDGNAPSVQHSFDTLAVEGLTGIESRAATHEAYRIRLTQTFIMTVQEAADLRNMLASLGDTRLALPLWMDDIPSSSYLANRIYASQYYVSYDTSGNVAVNALTYGQAVGLVIGRLVDLPQIQPINKLEASVTFTLQEDSPWEMRVSTNATPPSSFNFQADWSNLIDESKWRIQSTPLGQGREAAVSGQESIRKLGQSADIVLMSRTDIGQFIAFFEAQRGTRGSFDAPVWYNPLVSSSNSITAHFGEDTLTVDYQGVDYANSTITLWEQLTLTTGSPAQERPARTWLYQMVFEGGTPNYFTSYEKPLVLASPSATFTPAKISHSLFTQTTAPESDKVDLTMDGSVACPLIAFIKLDLERKLFLKIWECDPADTSTAVVLFDGQVLNANSKGRLITARAATMGDIMSRSIPRHQIQTTCNYTVGDSLCQQDMTSFTVTGTLGTIAGTTVNVACSSAAAADYYTEGWALFGSGDTAERRAIIRSTPVSGGQQLVLHKPLKQTGAIAVTFYAGCDGQYSTCGAKFNNAINFGGFPYTPSYIDTVATGFKPKMGK